MTWREVIGTYEELSCGAPILVLAPHPDDESLGCGGLLAQAFANHGAHVVCLTDGSASHPGSREWPAARLGRLRRAELILAVTRLGGAVSDITWLGVGDGELGQADVRPIVEQITKIIHTRHVRSLFAPAVEDHHADHKAAAVIAAAVCAASPGLALYAYPVWSRWDDANFVAHVSHHGPIRLPTQAVADRKRAAIYAHESQLGSIVTDAPTGFKLPDDMVETFVLQDEIFWRVAQ